MTCGARDNVTKVNSVLLEENQLCKLATPVTVMFD